MTTKIEEGAASTEAKVAETPPPAPKVEAKVEPKVAEAKGTPVVAAEGDKGPKRTRVGADDEEIPEDAELLELSPSALKKRLARNTAKELKERFGTADMDVIKKKLDRIEALEAKEKESERAAMSEREKLEADLKSEKQKRVDAERRLNVQALDRVIEKQESRVAKIAEKHIDPDFIDDGLYKRLALWLKEEFKPEELKTLKDEKIEKFFVEEVKRTPKRGKNFGATAAAEEKVVEKVPLNNGAKPAGAGGKQASGGAQQRNFSPSAPNAMTRSEARAEAAKAGHHW